MTFDAKTVTHAELETLTPDQLRPFMPALVNAYQASKDPATQMGDITRLQLRTAFFDKAYERAVLPISHAEYLENLKDGSNKGTAAPGLTPKP